MAKACEVCKRPLNMGDTDSEEYRFDEEDCDVPSLVEVAKANPIFTCSVCPNVEADYLMAKAIAHGRWENLASL